MTLLTGSWLLDAALVLVPLLYWYMTRNFDYWKKLGIPYMRPMPFVGNMGSVLLGRQHMGEPVLECYQRAGDAPFMGMFAFDQPLLMVKDPELVGRIMSTDFSVFYATNVKIDPVADPVVATSLFGQHGPGWKKLRTALSPAFTSGKIKLMFHLVNEVGQNLVRHLEIRASKELTNELIAGQLMSFLFAGFDTSSSTLSFCLYELVRNPELQEEVRQHIRQVLKRHGGQPTYEALTEMKDLTNVVNEALRMYPPVNFHDREAARDYRIPGTDITLPKGTGVVFSVAGLHHDPRYWDQPHRFMPSRFSEENSRGRPSYTFLPFGEGPRLCIGMRVAYLQVKLCLVHVLTNFEVLPAPQTPASLRYEPSKFIGTPAGKVALRFRRIATS